MKKFFVAVALTAFIGSYTTSSFAQDGDKKTTQTEKKCCDKKKTCCDKDKKKSCDKKKVG